MAKLEPKEYLRKYWGHQEFRPLQLEIIQNILSGRDTMALLPTGAGKSICFQVPGLILEGLTLVISPLIALMNDQVAQLRRRKIKAACIHSNLHYKEVERVLDNAQYGDLKFLYVSPERLQSSDFWLRLGSLPVAQLAVDEAHCISMWGYDFRPSYLKIAEVRTLFPKMVIVALTATATPEVMQDMASHLQLRNPKEFIGSFLRPNLKFGVLTPEDKMDKTLRLLKIVKGPAIVYVRNRRQTRELATFLERRGMSAQHYHAGLEAEDRTRRQLNFMEGKSTIMVATNAFGMGIDKSDVRMVIHYELPESLEAYYQEAGRAGRDGLESYAVLLFQKRDYFKLVKQYELSFPGMPEIVRVYRALGNYLKLAVGSGEGVSFSFDVAAFAKSYDFDAYTTWSVLKILEQAGWLVLSEGLYQPSRMIIRVEKDTLYDYQLRNKAKDVIIRGILRLYQGVLQDFVKIKENQMSSFLNISSRELVEALQEMQQDSIIEYIPRNDSGKLTMLHTRVAHENLTIDHKLLEFRKERRRRGIEAISQYVDLESCRQKYLVNYFGDDSGDKCGICDNCRKERENINEDRDFHILREQITRSLHESDKSIADLRQEFKEYDAERLDRVLQFMLDEEFLVKRADILSNKI